MLVCFVVAKKARNEIQQRQSEPPAWSDDLGRLITGDESLHFEGLPRLQTRACRRRGGRGAHSSTAGRAGPASATATAIVSAWTSSPTNRIFFFTTGSFRL